MDEEDDGGKRKRKYKPPKTKMCKKVMEGKVCKDAIGHKCKFAHNATELFPVYTAPFDMHKETIGNLNQVIQVQNNNIRSNKVAVNFVPAGKQDPI